MLGCKSVMEVVAIFFPFCNWIVVVLLFFCTEEELIIPDPNKGKKALAAILRLKSSKRRLVWGFWPNVFRKKKKKNSSSDIRLFSILPELLENDSPIWLVSRAPYVMRNYAVNPLSLFPQIEESIFSQVKVDPFNKELAYPLTIC